jgi:SAM-dependent methyltransferase
VPRAWFGEFAGARVLALASGGGQQGPVFAAAGARVTVLDNSPAQLAQDRLVAERDGLELDLQLGEMTDLSRFADGSFDLIFHPCANVFIPDVRPMWRECFRVLRPGGRLLVGFTQPVCYLFNYGEGADGGDLVVRQAIPYADTTALTPEQLQQRVANRDALEFGHTLEDQIGGQLDARAQAMTDQFISEAITPDAGSFGLPAVAGEPALPRRFAWRQRTYEVREVVRAWKEHEPDRTHGSGELYLRKHWFEVRVDDGSVMKLYFQRQPASGRAAKVRWWLYTRRAAGDG